MIKLDRQSLLQIAAAILLLIVGAWGIHTVGIDQLFLDRHRLLGFIDRHRSYAVFIFIGLQALQVVAAPIPGEVTGLVGGYLFGTGPGIIFSTIGLTLGSWTAFLIARLLGRHLVERLVSPNTIRKYDYVLKHKGRFLVFLMYLIPGFPKDILCYVLGLGHLSQGEFLVVSTVGRLFGTILLTVGGTLFRDARYVAFSVVVGLGVTAVLLVMVYRRNIELWMRSRRLAWHRRARAQRSSRRELERENGNR
jgi:uncharacterized membrane protein YdjX (TVP38/TMEM64 family)